MKRIITAAAALAAVSALIAPVRASGELTADRVKELLYASSIANSADKEELLSYEYSCLESDDINAKKKLTELGDISKSFKMFSVPPPYEGNTYYEYKEGDIFKYIESGSAIRHDDYKIEMPDASGRYIPIMLYGETVSYSIHEANIMPNESISLDLGRLADTINAAEIGNVSDIKLCHMMQYFYYIRSDKGEFAVSETALTNRFKDNETLSAWTVYPLARYFEFETDRAVDSDKAADTTFTKLKSVKVPEEFDIKGDEIRETNCFDAYEMQTNPFVDTSGITAKAVSLLYDMGAVNGCGDNRFFPSQAITPAQTKLILNRLMNNNADYTAGYDGAITFENAAYIILRLLGDWDTQMPLESMIDIYPWLTAGIENIDTSAPLSRGDFAVMVCSALDRNMWTYGIDSNTTGMRGSGGIKQDIHLIDYINGRKLNGMYALSKQDGAEWTERYLTWFYNECGDILYEYYGDGRGLTAEMERYGWRKPE